MSMKLALIRARTRRSLRRFLADKRGVSAVEFAMLLPLMVTLYLGGAEVTQAVAVDRKMTMVARTLADLTAQATSVSDTDISNIKDAASAVIAPFDSTKLGITISSVIVDAQKVAKIKWSEKNSSGTTHIPGDIVLTMPAALKESATYPIYLVWAESKYVYTPTVGYVITGPMNLTDEIYMRPRLSDCVLRPGTQTSC
jgi:Flp pilus assembly protein TadG